MNKVDIELEDRYQRLEDTFELVLKENVPSNELKEFYRRKAYLELL